MIGNGRGALWGSVLALVLPFGIGGSLLWDRPGGEQVGAVDGGGAAEVGLLAPAVDSLAARARTQAPFRPDGRPSRVAYDPVRSEQPQLNDGMPRPAPFLTGLVGGVRPLAVVAGVPGRDGPVVLGVGDTAAGLRVIRIKEGRVTMTGMDTTWTLIVRGAP